MEQETVIQFFMSLLQSCQIPVRRFFTGEAGAYDLGLRRALGMDPYAQLPQESAIMDNTVYDLTDMFSWRYHLLRLPRSGQYLLIGPYLREPVGSETLMSIMDRAGIPPCHLEKLRSYYRSVTVCPSESMLYAAIGKLGEALWGTSAAFTTSRRSLELLDVYQPAEDALNSMMPESFDRERIELTYQTEEALMYAIAHGKTRRAQEILRHFSVSDMEKRSAVPLRNFKNYLIILNTLMRKAVQQGGVHPIYIDRTSSAVAHRIEQCASLADGYKLMEDMIRKYCLLVKNHNLNQYSQPVQSVILQIDSEIASDLSLRAHAGRLGVNASYLSALFRKETGSTLTDYVNHKRVDFAIYLLNTTDMQIQTIAQYCGIPDMNYFSRVFKRLIGKTPSQYREAARSGAQSR